MSGHILSASSFVKLGIKATHLLNIPQPGGQQSSWFKSCSETSSDRTTSVQRRPATCTHCTCLVGAHSDSILASRPGWEQISGMSGRYNLLARYYWQARAYYSQRISYNSPIVTFRTCMHDGYIPLMAAFVCDTYRR